MVDIFCAYGHVKRGEAAHNIIQPLEYISSGELYGVNLRATDAGFPVCTHTGDENDHCRVELYRLDNNGLVLRMLDSFHSFKVSSPEQSLFKRVVIDTEFGPAYLYVINEGRINAKSGDFNTLSTPILDWSSNFLTLRR